MTNLRRARVLKEFTQFHLGQKTGIPQSRISLLENGLIATEGEKTALARALGCRVGELFPSQEPGGEAGVTQASVNP